MRPGQGVEIGLGAPVDLASLNAVDGLTEKRAQNNRVVKAPDGDVGTRLTAGRGRYSIVDIATRLADPGDIFLTYDQEEVVPGGRSRSEEESA